MIDKINIPWQKLTIISILAGIIYNSWPLGYWLNPIVARRGLGSELEGLHQPYNWLFIGGDVVSSLLIGLVAVWLWSLLRRQVHRTVFDIALLNIGGFSVCTIVDALLPLHCDPSIQRCPSFVHDPLLLMHGIFSIAASVFLFISLLLIWWIDRRDWLLQALLYGYVLFGIFSLIPLFTPGRNNWSQHYYLTLCSVWLAVLPYAIHRFVRETTGRNPDL
jgi:hypothetical protein